MNGTYLWTFNLKIGSQTTGNRKFFWKNFDLLNRLEKKCDFVFKNLCVSWKDASKIGIIDIGEKIQWIQSLNWQCWMWMTRWKRKNAHTRWQSTDRNGKNSWWHTDENNYTMNAISLAFLKPSLKRLHNNGSRIQTFVKIHPHKKQQKEKKSNHYLIHPHRLCGYYLSKQ